MKKIYRGIWADKLSNGEVLPIGGSLLGEDLTININLDFDYFKGRLDNYLGPENMSKGYEENSGALNDWLLKINLNVDPYLFFVTSNVQRKVENLLKVDRANAPNSIERTLKIGEGANLTDLVGSTMCAEQAALGQYLLQNVLKEGYSSSYMSGVECLNPKEELENHSFLVIKDSKEKRYIFDIARPHIKNGIQRILNVEAPFTYDLFKDTEDLIVEAEEVLRKEKDYFGVGNPMSSDMPKVFSK